MPKASPRPLCPKTLRYVARYAVALGKAHERAATGYMLSKSRGSKEAANRELVRASSSKFFAGLMRQIARRIERAAKHKGRGGS